MIPVGLVTERALTLIVMINIEPTFKMCLQSDHNADDGGSVLRLVINHTALYCNYCNGNNGVLTYYQVISIYQREELAKKI